MNGGFSKILYRIAVPSECDRIREALLAFYFPEEILTRSYLEVNQTIIGPSEEHIQYVLSFVQQGMVALAIEEDHGTIVGVTIARCVKPATADELLALVPSAGTRRWAEMLRMYAHLEHTGDVCGRFRSRRSYHVFVLAVEPHFRRRAIGQKLMEFQLARGKSLRFRVVSADFTCEIAARIGERMDMRCVSAMSLNQYRNQAGENTFVTSSVNHIVSTYARYV
ncbi:arylalkylamine N-acetyltransferase-like 2 [Anopheles marshallii]|uniref:arylalkylamine N-acetyltransferase-like 2 n=1 Tax=Anopheles marshallii TaxID=1521116 RepID=UPI00237B2B5C|nr:arylalkylamine N-acetyltransferase-like 2 [Anopheles marshallii]